MFPQLRRVWKLLDPAPKQPIDTDHHNGAGTRITNEQSALIRIPGKVTQREIRGTNIREFVNDQSRISELDFEESTSNHQEVTYSRA